MHVLLGRTARATRIAGPLLTNVAGRRQWHASVRRLNAKPVGEGPPTPSIKPTQSPATNANVKAAADPEQVAPAPTAAPSSDAPTLTKLEAKSTPASSWSLSAESKPSPAMPATASADPEQSVPSPAPPAASNPASSQQPVSLEDVEPGVKEAVEDARKVIVDITHSSVAESTPLSDAETPSLPSDAAPRPPTHPPPTTPSPAPASDPEQTNPIPDTPMPDAVPLTEVEPAAQELPSSDPAPHTSSGTSPAVQTIPDAPQTASPPDVQADPNGSVLETADPLSAPTLNTSGRRRPRAAPATSSSGNVTEPEYAAALVHGRALFAPYHHPKTHGVPVAVLHFRAHHPGLLETQTHFAQHAAAALGVPTGGTAMLPTQRSLWTVPTAPFVHKSSQENFERTVHKRAIKAWDAHPEVVARWIRYLRAHQVPGVGMRAVTWTRAEVGVGKKQLRYLEGAKEERISKEVARLGEKIIREELAAAAGPDAVAKA